MAKDYSSVKYQPTENSKKCCNKEILKTFLLFFDSIVILTGLALIAVGIYLLISRNHFTAILANEVFFLSNYIILGAGVIVLGIAILGLIAVCKSWPKMLAAYCWLLQIIFIVEIVGGVMALLFMGNAQEILITRLRSIMQNDFGRDEELSGAITKLQTSFRCCGAKNYHDWEKSYFVMSNQTKSLVPQSCCISQSDGCGKSTHPSNIHDVGCVTKFAILLKKNLILISIFSLSVAVIQLLGVIVGCCLYREMNLESKKRNKPSTYRSVNGRRGEIELQKMR